jgi:hypothetical protein
MRQYRSSGSVEGVMGNHDSYQEKICPKLSCHLSDLDFISEISQTLSEPCCRPFVI